MLDDETVWGSSCPFPPDDPLLEILRFHAVLRRALDALEEAAASAERGERETERFVELAAFFSGPLRFHDADEESLLMPLLRRVEHPPRLERMLDNCTRAHRTLEARLDQLLPHLEAVARGAALPDPRHLRETASALRSLLEAHLKMEEQEVIPLARLLLDEGDLRRLSEALAARATSRGSARERSALPPSGTVSAEGTAPPSAPAIRRILVPTDFSPCSAAALRYALELAEQVDAEVDLLHVLPPDEDPPSVDSPPSGATPPTSFDAALHELGPEKVLRVRTLLERGDPADVIMRVAREVGHDLVVMGTHGRSGVAYLLLGSVAERVVRRAPCPVLTLRDGDVSLPARP